MGNALSLSSPMITSWCRTGDCVLASPRNSAFPAGPLNSIASRAPLRMSRMCASSRGKVRLRALQDSLAPNPIGTPLDGALRYEIHLAPDDAGKLLFHRDVVQQTPVGVRGKACQ